MLIHSRAGSPPSALKLLHRYCSPDRSELLRGYLNEAERWMAESLQTHLSHPVLTFYRALHERQSWLMSLTVVLDGSALLIVGGTGILAAQAELTYRMGLVLLKDLTDALSIPVDPQSPPRLRDADLPALIAAAEAAGLPLKLGPTETRQLLRLVRRYEVYVVALADWLVIRLPPWIPAQTSEPGDSAKGCAV